MKIKKYVLVILIWSGLGVILYFTHELDKYLGELVYPQGFSSEVDKDLSNRGLTKFPVKLGRLKGLKTINLSGNLIEGKVAMKGFNDLEQLSLSRKKVRKLVIEPNSCQQLQKLDFSYNQIRQVEVHERLPKLKVLKLNSNMVQELPNLRAIPNVEELILNDNLIHTLPDNILKLEHLRFVNLSDNPLSDESEMLMIVLRDKGVQIRY